MATYTTTSCPHCGFKTRNFERGTPSIELGQTIICCPRCSGIIIDSIATEYEFMTNFERGYYCSTNSHIYKSLIGIFLFMAVGILSLLSTVLLDFDEKPLMWFALIFGSGCLYFGISGIINCFKAKDLNLGEQEIYESLLRTSNEIYVAFLCSAYNSKKGKRVYRPLENRDDIIREYEKYSTQEIHSNFQTKFNTLLSRIGQ